MSSCLMCVPERCVTLFCVCMPLCTVLGVSGEYMRVCLYGGGLFVCVFGGRVSFLVVCASGCLCVCVMACIIPRCINPHIVG